MSQNNHSTQKANAHRNSLIRDRLWQMKKAAIDIMQLVDTEENFGDCDGICDSCVLHGLVSPLMCSEISEIAIYPLDFAVKS